MTLHDRLRPPTLEAPPAHASHGLLVAMALVVLAAGFAYAMPGAQNMSAEGSGTDEPEAIVAPTPSVTPTATATAAPDPQPTDAPDEEDGEDAPKENHGQAVSTAAHCDIRGQAHGQLVRSIATDKDATVADAEAACAAAIAAQEAAPAEERGKPEHTKPEHTEPPGHEKQAEADVEEPVETDSDDHGKPDKPKH